MPIDQRTINYLEWIYDILLQLSSKEYQARNWIAADDPDIVSSLGETLSQLFDTIDAKNTFPFVFAHNPELSVMLQDLLEKLESLQWYGIHIEQVLAQKSWEDVRETASAIKQHIDEVGWGQVKAWPP